MRTAEAAARGVVFVHSCPRALIPHVDWAVERSVQSTHPYEWAAQPVQTGMSRCEIQWFGPVGAGAQMASALRGFPNLRFEITEDGADGQGERFCFTPSLGMFRALTTANGDIVVGEQRLRALLDGGEDVAGGLRQLLGGPWDDELEPFRIGGDEGVRWLTRVG